MLETSHLRCFVAVAQELHFGRAAARLNMTQPPLSRQIQLLERALGCEVFTRNSRSVILTPAGAALLPDAQRILRLLENASKGARDVAAGRRGTVNCGFTAASAYRFLPALVGRIKVELPDASLMLREMVSKRQIAALDAGELDVGLFRPPVDRTSYQSRMVAREDLVLALPRDHHLLARSSLSWRDVDRQDMLMYDPRDAHYFYDLLASRFVQEGIFPNYVQHLTQIHTILSLVRSWSHPRFGGCPR
jgi:DNA-binding transcriptional LysR family regulator